jgi:hypothetical protein
LMQVSLQFIDGIQKITLMTLIETLHCSFFLLGSLLERIFYVILFVLLEMVLPIFDFII